MSREMGLKPPYFDGLQDEAGRPIELEPVSLEQIEQLEDSYRKLFLATSDHGVAQRDERGFLKRIGDYISGIFRYR